MNSWEIQERSCDECRTRQADELIFATTDGGIYRALVAAWSVPFSEPRRRGIYDFLLEEAVLRPSRWAMAYPRWVIREYEPESWNTSQSDDMTALF
jgi:hypothetical protein